MATAICLLVIGRFLMACFNHLLDYDCDLVEADLLEADRVRIGGG